LSDYEQTYGLKHPADDVYAVVSSPSEHMSDFKQLFSDIEPATWPVRHYAWGTAAVFNPQHSDTFALRIMLLETGFTHVNESTEAIYQAVIADSPPYWTWVFIDWYKAIMSIVENMLPEWNKIMAAIVMGFLFFALVLKGA
jgi:hypothetical protein